MKQTIKAFFLDPRTAFAAYLIAALAASAQLIGTGPHLFGMPQPGAFPPAVLEHLHFKEYVGYYMVDYNNYVIFKQSYFHLIQGKDLYCIYPASYWDLYKYSPTFALFMAPFAYLPDYLGLPLWNLLNALALLFAVRLLPFSTKTQTLLLWFMGVELLTSMQNAQSNGLMTGLIIAAYSCLQNKKTIWATLWLVLSVYIKVYGAIGFCLFLFFPDKLKFIGHAAFWAVLLALLPLAVTPIATLIWQYHNWAAMMTDDQAFSNGLSVMGWLHSWFGIDKGKGIISAIGILLFLLPFLRWKLYPNQVYQLLTLASLLIWVIIFNHKAESPTFIIAIAGVGIWYFTGQPLLWRNTMLALVFIFTCLSPSDVFPHFIREHYFEPYAIKAIPCIALWAIVFITLMTMKSTLQLPDARRA